jgi:Tfp pilus assembly protein PilX
MTRLLTRRVGAARSDAGFAMLFVMASAVILGMLVGTAYVVAQQAQTSTRRDQDWTAALSAAQSGVDDYIARLNQSDSYWTAVDCTNIAMKGPNSGTNTCGYTSATAVGWQNVKPGDATAGQFHYDVDSSTIWSQGVIKVTSTGRVNGRFRTIQVLVSRGGSTDFLYYTDFEDADPANTVAYPSGAPSDACGKSGTTKAKYYWQTRSGCVEIQFATGDVLDGAVHFNDTPNMGGTVKFMKGYETSDPGCATTPYKITNCDRGSGTPNLNGTSAQYAPLLYLPDNSSQFSTYPGCQYTGDTRIKFNSNGTMTVWSTKSTGTTMGTGCGSSTGSWPQTVNVPDGNVIYIKNASTTAKCTTGQIGDGLPLANDDNVNQSTFYCGGGNLYVEGTVKGRVTLAAQNNIIVTGDLLLASTPVGSNPTGSDMVGLVAANSVVVAHPTAAAKVGSVNIGDNLTATGDRWIYASIQTLQHSFWVQEYDQGTKMGTLHVRGSIAQRWRGIVGTGSSTGTGYLKDYGYDSRLKFSAPPYFPQWTNAVWGAKTTAELTPQYTS